MLLRLFTARGGEALGLGGELGQTRGRARKGGALCHGGGLDRRALGRGGDALGRGGELGQQGARIGCLDSELESDLASWIQQPYQVPPPWAS